MSCYSPRAGSRVLVGLSALYEAPMNYQALATLGGMPRWNVWGNYKAAVEGGWLEKVDLDGVPGFKITATGAKGLEELKNLDGQPRAVETRKPPTKPSAEALAAANPFGSGFRPRAIEEVEQPAPAAPQALPAEPDALQTHQDEPSAEPIPSLDLEQPRIGIYNDGWLVIEHGGATVALSPDSVTELRTYLTRMAA